jgi:thioredoxin-dependent peroxiredoxin
MKIGDVVEDFVLPDEHGVTRSLNGLLRRGAVVLFFYPGVFRFACTRQVCHVRDVAREFAQVGALPVGVSSDLVPRQAAFAQAYALGFPLLSDPSGEVRGRFGVRRTIGPWPTKRVTFVIDRDRRVIEIVRSEIRVNAHADRALQALRRRRFSWFGS